MATDLNDLPVTSPHGSDFGHHAQILGLAADPNAARGTVTAHRDKCCDIPDGCKLRSQNRDNNIDGPVSKVVTLTENAL
jgi:hypothetical protein